MAECNRIVIDWTNLLPSKQTAASRLFLYANAVNTLKLPTILSHLINNVFEVYSSSTVLAYLLCINDDVWWDLNHFIFIHKASM
nr:MAG TPA: hypothetical protein [Caudoviricetes sp.]